MFAAQRFEDLAQRRQLLLAQAQLQRQLIGLELGRLTERLPGVGSAGGPVSAWRRYGWLAAPILGLVITRRWRPLSRWAGRTAMLWRLLKTFR